MSGLWRARDAEIATGGRATTDWEATSLSIDTRSLEPGALFVALKDQRDGHDFVAAALQAGAAAALVSRVPEGVAEDAPLLIVEDVLEALEALGRFARTRSRAKVAAITGSVGKTSTKEMLRAVLTQQGKVHAAERSFNNHWGVPLTLARMPEDADFAIIEIGMNHPGEIEPLSDMTTPDVAMITTVAAAHLEAFDALEGIAWEKSRIFTGLAPGGIAVLNGDLPTTPMLMAAAKVFAKTRVQFGETGAASYRLLQVDVREGQSLCQATGPTGPFVFKLRTPGRHFAVNALGVLAVVEALGADVGLATVALAHWVPPAGRGTREEIVLETFEPDQAFTLIDDAFNANPASMTAALEVLALTNPTDGLGQAMKGRRIAVLGDMLELGPEEASLHAAIADDPSLAAVDIVHTVGARMAHLRARLAPDLQGLHAEVASELAAVAHQFIDAGDVVLVKGSKGSEVSRVVDALRKLGQAPQNSLEGSS